MSAKGERQGKPTRALQRSHPSIHAVARVDSKPKQQVTNSNGTATAAAAPKKSAWGVPAAPVVQTERATSAFPALREAMTNLSLNTPASGLTAVAPPARSSSANPPKRRSYLQSAVPDSAILTPVRRPDEGGKLGKAINVYTNHFPVKIDDCFVNQYDIEIYMIGRDQKPRLARKDERWETVQRIAKAQKNFPVIWYDEGKTIYTKELLTDVPTPLQITFKSSNEEKTFQLHILNLVRQEKMRDIYDFIEKKTSIRPRECIRIVETLFKQRSRNDLVAIRNQFYDRRQTLDDLGKSRVP